MENRRLRSLGRATSWAAAVVLAAASIATAEAPSNVLMITLDTFRGDHLGANGSTRAETPCLDRLAETGANFTRARAQVPLTLPSHASIMTGRYPHSHGVRNNGVAALGSEATTLAEVLEAEGYATGAFVGSFVLDHRFGLDQGFEHYDDRVVDDPAMLERVDAERGGGDVVRAFEAWLSEQSDERPAATGRRPFMAWIHFYDPHAPYEAPQSFRNKYPKNAYVAEIAYTDSLVCRAIDALGARGLLPQTLVAVVGDHGEGLGEHRETTHSLLIYNSTLHVPMLIRRPGQVPAVPVADLVQTIDLAPTLLDYLGLDDQFGEGTSLKSLIERRSNGGKSAEPSRSSRSPSTLALSESLYGAHTLGWSPLFGLEEGGFHFIQAPEPELFDLEQDPAETRNVFAEFPEVAARLASRLESELLSGTRQERLPEVALDPGEIAKLRSLGYLAGGAAKSPPAEVIDPKAKVDIWERLQIGIGRYSRGEHESAARELESVLRTERDLPLLYEYLSASYVGLEDWEKFERLHALANARGVESAALHMDKGRRCRTRREFILAEAAFERALDLEPLSVTARYELGELRRAQGRLEAAIEAYREALAINPGYAFAWNGLGVALSEPGNQAVARAPEATDRQEKALEAFQRAVEFAPRDPRSVLNLAVQLERMGRRVEALEHYERCLELAPATGSDPARNAATVAIRRLQATP